MAPQFPHFKKIEVSDRETVTEYTKGQRPYSAFNFTNVWAWDVKNDRKIADLNGNLVLYSTDYETNQPFLSYIGRNKPVTTTLELLEYASSHKLSPTLRFVTEETVRKLKSNKFHILTDRDNFDYVFSTSRLANPSGPGLKTKRLSARRFQREFPNATFEIHDFCNRDIQKKVAEMLNRWEHNKKLKNKVYEVDFEKKALHRLLDTAEKHNLLLSCIFSEEHDIIAFSIDEIVHNKMAIGHFVKADVAYKGIYDFLNERTAQCLVAHGVRLWNWQQDLGIQGLRQAKMSYRPLYFLKRYRVTLETKGTPYQKADMLSSLGT